MPSSIACFLCKGMISYKNKDATRFETHMRDEHMVHFGLEYLLASCVMSEKERLAVLEVAKDVMKERIKPIKDQDTTLEEEVEEVVEVDEDIEEVMEVQEIKKVSKPHTKAANLEKIVQGFSAKKLKISRGREEIRMKDLTSTTTLVKKYRKGGESKHVAEKGEDPGTGTVCPLCSKEFPKNGPMRRHFEDIHQPGEFPCAGCGKVFTSKNKMSSHYSRNCKRRTL